MGACFPGSSAKLVNLSRNIDLLPSCREKLASARYNHIDVDSTNLFICNYSNRTFFRSSTMCYGITTVACLELQAISMFAISL